MNKKVLGVFVSVLAVMAVAGISYGVTMKLKASDNDVYKDRVTAKKSFKFKGEELSYVDPDDADPLYYEKIAYKDGEGLLYYFDADTHKLNLIDGMTDKADYSDVSTDSVNPYADSEALLKNAKERVTKWIAGSENDKVEWRTETDETGTTRIRLYQSLNDEFSVILASVVYDMEGRFLFAHINYDSVLDGDDYKECISKEEAITKAKDFVLQKYGESDWGEITAYEKTGDGGIYWMIQCMRKTYGGYAIRVDAVTGEATFFSMMK